MQYLGINMLTLGLRKAKEESKDSGSGKSTSQCNEFVGFAFWYKNVEL